MSEVAPITIATFAVIQVYTLVSKRAKAISDVFTNCGLIEVTKSNIFLGL